MGLTGRSVGWLMYLLVQWAVSVGPEGAVGVGAEGLSVTERRVLLVLEQRALLLVLSVGAVGTAGDPTVLEPTARSVLE